MRYAWMLFVLLFACSSESFPSVVSVSWSGSLTGVHQIIGTEHLRGFMIGVDEINKAGGVKRAEGAVRLEVKSFDAEELAAEADVLVEALERQTLLTDNDSSVSFPFKSTSSRDFLIGEYERRYLSKPENMLALSAGYESSQVVAQMVAKASSLKRIVR